MTFKEHVHNALAAIVEDGPFYAVEYDEPVEPERFHRMRVDKGKRVEAQQFEANETGFALQEERKDRMDARRGADLDAAEWEVHVEFGEQVAAEAFLEGFARWVTPADAALRPYRLRVTGAEATHPPRREPANGTYLRLTVRAEPAPRQAPAG